MPIDTHDPWGCGKGEDILGKGTPKLVTKKEVLEEKLNTWRMIKGGIGHMNKIKDDYSRLFPSKVVEEQIKVNSKLKEELKAANDLAEVVK